MDQKPKLKDINKYVKPFAAHKWDDIGLELEVGDEDGRVIDSILTECNEDEERFKKMIRVWFQSESPTQVTWSNLLTALKELGLEEAVRSVEQNVLQVTDETSSQEQNTREAKRVKPVVTTDGIKTLDSMDHNFSLALDQKQADKLEQSMALTEDSLSIDHQLPLATACVHHHSESKLQDSDHQLPVETASLPYDSESMSKIQDQDCQLPVETASLQHHSEFMSKRQDQDCQLPVTVKESVTEMLTQNQTPLVQVSVTSTHDMDSQTHKAKPVPTQQSPVKPSLTCKPVRFKLQLEERMIIRNYQTELAEPGINGENYIYVAPTGSGKTLIAVLITLEHLNKKQSLGETAKVIFLVNTKPLAEQQRRVLSNQIKGARVECITGESEGSVKSALQENDIVVCTAGKFVDEVNEGAIKIDDVSLILIDECHNTRKKSMQAKLMTRYLQIKHGKSRRQLPQVVGLTASPGAGDNPHLDNSKTIDHLVNFCAIMDATSGIKTVQKHKKELEEFTTKPILTRETPKRRSEDEEFLKVISKEMEHLEEQIDLKMSSVPKWSQQYDTRIQQEKRKLELSSDKRVRDKISTLELLLCFTEALNVYMDLQHEDALGVLVDFTHLPECSSVSTDYEKILKERLDHIIRQLKVLPIIENPLLKKAEEILVERFQDKSDSRGIFFVRTKRHAVAISKWIENMAIRRKSCLKPELITGHLREIGYGMTQADQEEAMLNFRTGKSNVLVATSVVEEGLDVPDCNFVIRFQHISNEIAKVQTQGRARAEDSKVFTILAYDSKMKLKEIKNAELIILVEKIMSNDWFPKKDVLRNKLMEIQKSILQEEKMRKSLGQKRRQAPGKDITLRCRKCKGVACCGSDIFTVGCHYLVPEEKFKEKLVKKLHHKPRKLTETLSKTHKIYCKVCDADWGVLCVWTVEGYEFPVLKCVRFLFESSTGERYPVSQWSKAPFSPLPLSDWIKGKVASSDDEEEDEM